MSGGIDCCSREEGSKEKPKEVRRVSKKTKRANCVPKTGAVWHLSAEEATLAKKPRYNGYACGHGAHGDAKYNRAKQKRVWKSAIRQEGTPRGPFLPDGAKFQFGLKETRVGALFSWSIGCGFGR